MTDAAQAEMLDVREAITQPIQDYLRDEGPNFILTDLGGLVTSIIENIESSGGLILTKQQIADYLVDQSLADHLGDIRDDEIALWSLLGINIREAKSEFYDDSVYRTTAAILKDHGFTVLYDDENDEPEEN